MNFKKEILKVFNKKERKEIIDYYKVIKLRKEGGNKKVILEKTKISKDRFEGWIYRKTKPTIVKIFEEFNLRYNKKISPNQLKDLAYLIGYNLGDGNISQNFCNSWFYGVYKDLFEIKEVLVRFKVKPVIYKYKIDNGKMAVHDRIFSRFLFIFGAVRGDKTKNKA